MACVARAQSSSTLMGARSAGLANASACLKDEWAIFNNVGGLAELDHSSIAFSYNIHPAFSSFNRIAAVATVPLKYGVTGIGLYRFGDDLYNEQLITCGFSNRFGIASLGAKVNYIQYHASGFGNKGVVTISFGGIAELTRYLSIGMHITNINQPTITVADTKEILPTILVAGIAVKPSDKLFVTSELEKEIDADIRWKNGLEYLFTKKIASRTGFSVNPTCVYYGISFSPKKIAFAYAMEYNLISGTNHQATIAYNFLSK